MRGLVGVKKTLEQTLFIKTELVNKQNLLDLFLKLHDFQGIYGKTRTENFYMMNTV